MTVRIYMFCKAPIAGRTKTRLIPLLGSRTAAQFSEAFLRDTLHRVRRIPELPITLSCAQASDAEALSSMGIANGLQTLIQPEGDLGCRMAQAVFDASSRGEAALLLGTDAPTLPFRYLQRAVWQLCNPDGPDLVLGPATDGGYYLLGFHTRFAALEVEVIGRYLNQLFQSVQWSTSSVLKQTQQNACACGLNFDLLAPWYDIDTPLDLRLLRLQLTIQPGGASHSARVLSSQAWTEKLL